MSVTTDRQQVDGDIAADLVGLTEALRIDHNDDGTITVIAPGVDDADLEAAIAAYSPPPPPPTIAEQVDALPDPTVDLVGFKAGLKSLLGAE